MKYSYRSELVLSIAILRGEIHVCHHDSVFFSESSVAELLQKTNICAWTDKSFTFELIAFIDQNQRKLIPWMKIR